MNIGKQRFSVIIKLEEEEEEVVRGDTGLREVIKQNKNHFLPGNLISMRKPSLGWHFE